MTVGFFGGGKARSVRPAARGLGILGAAGLALTLLGAPLSATAAPTSVGASAAADPASHDTAVRAPDVAGNPASAVAGKDKLPEAASTYQRMKPTTGVGMPTPDAYYLQKQYSPLGEYAHWIHNVVLMPLMAVISLLVLGLLVWVVVRYNSRANQVPSRTSHNTVIEVIWTLLPVLILVGIAIPSIDLLAKQYRPAPAKALTVKVTGNQWFWSYTYPDNGGFELTSYMLNLPGQPVINNGVRYDGSDPSDGPSHLEVDTRLVLPAGEPIRLQVTGADVIHSFAIPSLWFKLDGVPGRINEKVLFIEKPGVYYGQCSELCGAKHGYMPIAIEALPRAQFDAWVKTQSGGVVDGQKPTVASSEAATPPPVLPKPAAAVGVGAPAPAESAGATPSPTPESKPAA